MPPRRIAVSAEFGLSAVGMHGGTRKLTVMPLLSKAKRRVGPTKTSITAGIQANRESVSTLWNLSTVVPTGYGQLGNGKTNSSYRP